MASSPEDVPDEAKRDYQTLNDALLDAVGLALFDCINSFFVQHKKYSWLPGGVPARTDHERLRDPGRSKEPDGNSTIDDVMLGRMCQFCEIEGAQDNDRNGQTHWRVREDEWGQ